MSTLLAQPDYARARPSTLLEKEQEYKKLFNSKTGLSCYFSTAYIGRLVCDTIKQEKKYTATEKTNIQFATLFYYISSLVGTTQITSKLIEEIDIDKLRQEDILQCADKVRDIFVDQGGTDKVAKSSSFTKALILSFEGEKTEQDMETFETVRLV